MNQEIIKKLLEIFVKIFMSVYVVSVINSYVLLFYLLYEIPLHEIPIWLVIYGIFSFAALIKTCFVPYFITKNRTTSTPTLWFIAFLAIVNYIALYQFIPPKNWFNEDTQYGIYGIKAKF